MNIIFGVLGVFAILFLAFLLSSHKRSINKRTVFGALFIQITFAVLVLYLPWGKSALGGLSNWITSALAAGNIGLEFVFGPLAQFNPGFIFAVSVLGTIVFFSSLISVLYFIGIMPLIINTLGLGLHKLLGTSRAESLSATSNIFVGQTEAPLVVKPFIKHMTKSELFAVMVGGLSTIAGGVLAGLASLGIDIGHLIAASFMAAPAGLLMAKMIMPETETPLQTLEAAETKNKALIEESKPTNVIEAAAEGASTGLHLALNVGAMLIAFIGLIALLDMIIGYFGTLAGIEKLSFKLILGYVFSPFALIIGVPLNEAITVGGLLGDKIVFNEFIAFSSLSLLPELSAHTKTIVTFALCGFANISSIGILLGGLGTIAPSQKKNIASFALKAVLAGNLANLLNATVAGILTSI